MRTIYRTSEFDEFYVKANNAFKKKLAYVAQILETQTIINRKVVKKLINTELYEIRIQISNEYRILTFTIDHEDINQAENIIFLNCFMKKSTKDYEQQIKKAKKILETWKEQK